MKPRFWFILAGAWLAIACVDGALGYAGHAAFDFLIAAVNFCVGLTENDREDAA